MDTDFGTGRFVYIDEILFNYRVHAGSATTSTLRDLDYIPALLRIAERHIEYLVDPNNSETQPYKIIIEKLMNIVDYSTNFLKLDFDSMLGRLGDLKKDPSTSSQLAESLSSSSSYSKDLHDFKRISYLSLLHVLDLRKELDWLYGEYNHLNEQLARDDTNDDSRTKGRQTTAFPLDKNTWGKQTKVLDGLRQENEVLHMHINQLSRQLDSLLNSQSWRLTAPLRMVRKKISNSEL